MKRINVYLCALALGFPLVASTEGPLAQNQNLATHTRIVKPKDLTRFHKMVDEAAGVYGAISKGKHGEIPSSVLKHAQCIAVLPSVFTGALVVGGTHGSGVASCKNDSNTWSQPAPISLNQGSIGLQAGAKSADLVLFFQSKEAVDALKRGNFELGADVSAVAGNFDSKIDTTTAGIVVYSRAEGLFAGASVNGGKIGKDQDDLARYYGHSVDYRALLEGRETPDSSGYSQKLTKLFP